MLHLALDQVIVPVRAPPVDTRLTIGSFRRLLRREMDCLRGPTWIFFDANFVDVYELMEITEYSEAGTQSGIQSLYV